MWKTTIGVAALAATAACGAFDNSGDAKPDAAVAHGSGGSGGSDAGSDAGSAQPGGLPTVCTPSTTTCAGGELATCDATGDFVLHHACELGCSADGARCAQFVPSNGVGGVLSTLSDPQDLTLDTGTLDPETGELVDGSGSRTLPSVLLLAPAGGAPIRVFAGRRISITGLVTVEHQQSLLGARGIGTAIAFVATDELDVSGELWVLSGAVDVAGCTGFGGVAHNTLFTGGGGGGFATAGANGGGIKLGAIAIPHGDGGGASGTDELVPLRGGCPGASGGDATNGGNGGGAVQLVSLAKVDVSGIVNVDGFGAAPGAGGGAGGGILIEAPEVALGNTAFVLARGGAGAGGDQGVQDPGTAGGAALGGGACTPPTLSSAPCSAGGAGATSAPSGDVAAQAAGGFTATAGQSGFAGGGGGGLGRARVNTATGALAPSAATIAAHLTVGAVATE